MDKMSKRMCFLLVVLATVMVMGVAVAQEAPNNLNAALEYLEGLDRYYSAKARPRYGRSVGSGPQRLYTGYVNTGERI
ncbi:hypothetical protein BIW11_13663 [Tropilaelaps mercedesae]|uniref:Uncharacterized protein n=1 Tax=Tropilaelaps mercedesae TaxID=418985 RepID=A0A1V9X1C9_9ACAR|nr:hypothetical protein BIW11_13663 [Tropilaelaps mercedesae]